MTEEKNQFDHTNPSQLFREYIDSEGKWKGQLLCICPECIARREREASK